MTTNTYGIMEDVWDEVYVPLSAPPPITPFSPGKRLFQLRKTYGNWLNKPCPIGTWENLYPENKEGWETYAVENPGQWELWCYKNKIWNCSFSSWLELWGEDGVAKSITIVKPTRKIRCLNRPGETREIV